LGFGGPFFRPLRVFVIDSRPERAEFFEGLVDRTATDVALEEVLDLCLGKAVFRSLRCSRMRSATESPTQVPKREAAE
jgi:hypothetical protein